MTRILLGLLALGLLAYLGMGLLLYLFQRNLIYYPTPALPHPGLTGVELESEGRRLHAWRVGADNSRAVLYFGGNAEDVGNNASAFAAALPGRTVYLTEYRGYGRSQGHPTERALYRDALAWFDHLGGRHSEITVIGRSLGSGVASYLAAQRRPAKLVLITPFDSVRALARGFYPLYPMSLIVKDSFDSLARAERIEAPCLILLAEHDAVVPAAHSLRLIQALTASPAQVRTLRGSDHTNISGIAEYWNLLRDFIEPGQAL